MTRLVALPHLRTSNAQVTPWLITIRGQTTAIPELLVGWDYETPISFQCTASANLDRVREDCGLSPSARVGLTGSWWSSSTNRRGLGSLVEQDDDSEAQLIMTLDPGVIGGRLTLERRLVLLDAGHGGSPLSATKAGSVLWQEDRSERTTVTLEGDAARFPTELIDFSSATVAEPSSGWWLEHKLADLDASPLASLRLHLNSAHPAITRMVEGSSEEADELLRRVLFWDVGRTLLNAALDREEFVQGWGHFPAGSLGETLQFLVQRAWPAHDARSLRSLRAADRSIFEARLQARFEALGA